MRFTMKKLSVSVLTFFLVLLLLPVIDVDVNAASYPSIFPDNYSMTVTQGEKIALKYTVFHEFKNECAYLKVHKGSRTGPIVATADRSFYNYNTYMTDWTVNWDTFDVEPGTYYVEYYMTFYSLYSWHEAPNHYYHTIEIKAAPCKNGHTFDAGKVTTVATCKAAGVKTFTCSVCGTKSTQSIPATPHIFGGWWTEKAATCTTPGQSLHQCVNCGTRESKEIPIASHAWDTGVVLVVPTETTTGIKNITCMVCKETRTEVIHAGATKNVNITYRGIKIKLNDKIITPCDEKGNTVEPFIMNSNSTTYMPLRAIAQALGLGVNWVDATSTVELTTTGVVKTGAGAPGTSQGAKTVAITYRGIKVKLDGKELKLVTANGTPVEPFIMNGTTYLPLRVVGEALGLTVGWDNATSTAILTNNIVPASVTLNKTSLWQYAGDTYQLTATVNPVIAANKQVTWTSSNPAVATVSANGLVKMIAPGKAIVTAKTANGKVATCDVNVMWVSATGVTLNEVSATKFVGEQLQLKATVAPANASNKNVTWSSSAPNVATVDANGLVRVVGKGVAIIKVSIGDFSAGCVVEGIVNQAETVHWITYYLNHNEDEDALVLSFTLQDEGQVKYLRAPGFVDVRIVNNDGNTVYTGTKNLTAENYTYSDGKYIAEIVIKKSEISRGSNKYGVLYFKLYDTAGELNFDEYSRVVSGYLPV